MVAEPVPTLVSTPDGVQISVSARAEGGRWSRSTARRQPTKPGTRCDRCWSRTCASTPWIVGVAVPAVTGRCTPCTASTTTELFAAELLAFLAEA